MVELKAQVLIFDNTAGGVVGNSGLRISGAISPVGSTFLAATRFVPTEGAVLSSVELDLSRILSATSADIYFCADAAGYPANGFAGGTALLGSVSFGNQFGSPAQTVVLTHLSSPPTVLAGESYWIIASPAAPDTWAAWNVVTFGATSAASGIGESGPDFAQWTASGVGQGGLRIYGEVVSVPESKGLTQGVGLVLCLGAVTVCRSRRRKLCPQELRATG